MSCERKRQKGFCGHFICPNDNGSCVDIADGYCECGEGCDPGCPYSFSGKDSDSALNAFETKYPEEG